MGPIQTVESTTSIEQLDAIIGAKIEERQKADQDQTLHTLRLRLLLPIAVLSGIFVNIPVGVGAAAWFLVEWQRSSNAQKRYRIALQGEAEARHKESQLGKKTYYGRDGHVLNLK